MTQGIRKWEVDRAYRNEEVYLKAFPGADVNGMWHYIQPTVKHNPDRLTIHCKTNFPRNTKLPLTSLENFLILQQLRKMNTSKFSCLRSSSSEKKQTK